MSLKRIALAGAAVVVGGAAVFAATPLGRDLIFHVVPLGWSGEPARLAAALRIGPGAAVADVGAGSGALIVELARGVGPRGRAYATERTPAQRQGISNRAASAGVTVTVIEAADRTTNLPDACCDAITMRMVMHHLADPEAFARDLRRSLRPGGRVGIIDFAPGALPHLAHDHGVSPEQVIAHFTAAGFAVERRDDAWGGRTYLVTFFIPTAHLLGFRPDGDGPARVRLHGDGANGGAAVHDRALEAVVDADAGCEAGELAVREGQGPLVGADDGHVRADRQVMTIVST